MLDYDKPKGATMFDEFRVEKTKEGGWRVYLPHQCDEWDIAGDEYTRDVTQAAASQALEDFIINGMDALRALNEGRQYKHGKVVE